MARGGAGRGQGRKPLPLYERHVKHSITLPVDVSAWVEEQRRPGEAFSEALTRLLIAHPHFAPPATRLYSKQ